jgi:hypothetical protein
VDFYLNGEWPTCACGCGGKVKWSYTDKRFRELSTEAENKWYEEELEKYASLFLKVCTESAARQEMLKKTRKKTRKNKLEDDQDFSDEPIVKGKKLVPLNKAVKSTTDKPSTYEKTLALVKEGKDLKSIAEERNITEGTVLGHILKLIEHYDDLDLSAFKPDVATIKKIETAMIELGDDVRGENGRILMTPIHQHLEESVPFDTIRLAMLFIKP